MFRPNNSASTRRKFDRGSVELLSIHAQEVQGGLSDSLDCVRGFGRFLFRSPLVLKLGTCALPSNVNEKATTEQPVRDYGIRLSADEREGA